MNRPFLNQQRSRSNSPKYWEVADCKYWQRKTTMIKKEIRLFDFLC